MKDANAELVALAWAARSRQDQETFLRLYLQLKNRLPAEDEPEQLADARLTPAVWAEIWLLHVSFLRQKARFLECEDVFARVRAVFWRLGLPLPPRYAMERGLNALAQSDYFKGLEEFSRAVDETKSPRTRVLHLQARLNQLICMEALGVPSATAQRDCRAVIARARDVKQIEFILDQWQALELRELFRSGRIRALLQYKTRPGTQGEYFRMWCARLPFHAHRTTPTTARLDHWLSSRHALYLGAYRLRTLQALSHPEDKQVAKLSQKISRLYLWTWLWLNEPERVSLAKLDHVLAEIRADVSPHKVGVDEVQMLRNAVHWIALLHPRQASELKSLMVGLAIGAERRRDTVFEIEDLVINWLRARREHDDELAQDLARLIRAHPLARVPDLYFGRLVELIHDDQEPGRKEPAFLHRLTRWARAQRPEASAETIVDLHRYQIRKGDRVLNSEAAVKLLWRLREESSIPPLELMKFVFGIPAFDPVIHHSKINNLLGRVRPLLPTGTGVRYRSGRVTLSGDFSGLAWVGATDPRDVELYELRFHETREPHASRAPSPAHPGELAVFGRRSFSRRELETHLRRSRAAVNRQLKKWLKDGVITADGQARATRYVVNLLEKG